MSDQELQEQFKRCVEWGDPEQWELLALEYYQRRYMLNASVCFQRADALRAARGASLLVGVSALDAAVVAAETLELNRLKVCSDAVSSKEF